MRGATLSVFVKPNKAIVKYDYETGNEEKGSK